MATEQNQNRVPLVRNREKETRMKKKEVKKFSVKYYFFEQKIAEANISNVIWKF